MKKSYRDSSAEIFSIKSLRVLGALHELIASLEDGFKQATVADTLWLGRLDERNIPSMEDGSRIPILAAGQTQILIFCLVQC